MLHVGPCVRLCDCILYILYIIYTIACARLWLSNQRMRCLARVHANLFYPQAHSSPWQKRHSASAQTSRNDALHDCGCLQNISLQGSLTITGKWAQHQPAKHVSLRFSIKFHARVMNAVVCSYAGVHVSWVSLLNIDRTLVA